jgi:dihydrofolate synthase/folylpolyglutamate synthase
LQHPGFALEYQTMGYPLVINSSADVFAWIAGFINMGRGQSYRSFRLDRMRVLSALAAYPEKSAPLVHVAGSKGKGSVTGMIAAMLEAEGLKAARYTSPDVMEKRERISRGNNFFDESVYVEAGRELVSVVEKLRSLSGPEAGLFDPSREEGEEPTFFELMTLYFFLCARTARCDAMVVETGMGGRLDATNIVEPLASVITLIEIEHAEYLGDTLAAIAGEKAGIVKAGKPLILAAQEDEALRVFRKEAAEKNSRLIYFPETVSIGDVSVSKGGTGFTLAFPGEGFFPRPLRLFLPIPGAVQTGNAGLALLAAKTAFPRLGEEAVRQGLGGFRLPARFERILEDPELVIDGAHTQKSMEQCAETFCSLYGEGGILVFGCGAGKNVQAMTDILIHRFSRIIVTTPGTFKKSNPDDVYAVFKSKARKGTEILLIKETGPGIEKALALGRELGLPVLGAGSFYLAAEIRQYLRGFQNRLF